MELISYNMRALIIYVNMKKTREEANFEEFTAVEFQVEVFCVVTSCNRSMLSQQDLDVTTQNLQMK
jgi:hypothetical protein